MPVRFIRGHLHIHSFDNEDAALKLLGISEWWKFTSSRLKSFQFHFWPKLPLLRLGEHFPEICQFIEMARRVMTRAFFFKGDFGAAWRGKGRRNHMDVSDSLELICFKTCDGTPSWQERAKRCRLCALRGRPAPLRIDSVIESSVPSCKLDFYIFLLGTYLELKLQSSWTINWLLNCGGCPVRPPSCQSRLRHLTSSYSYREWRVCRLEHVPAEVGEFG